jgi:hypothetical protein
LGRLRELWNSTKTQPTILNDEMPDTRGKTDSKSSGRSSPVPKTTTSTSNDLIYQKMDEYFTKLSQKFDESTGRIENKLDDKIDQLRADIKDDIISDILPRIEQNTGHITATNRRVTQLEVTVKKLEHTLELKTKENELIVRGVPVVVGENCQNVYQSLATAIGYNSTQVPLADAFRLKGRGNLSSNSPPILVKFALKFDKIAFYNKYFKKKTLNLTDIGYQTSVRIYISENLTKQNQHIFGAALQLKKDGVIASVSTHFGAVSVKKTREGNRITIGNMADLDVLTNDDQNKTK